MNEQADKNAERGNFWSRRSRKGKTFIVIVGAFLALGTISAVASPSEEKASALPAPAVETVTQTVTEEAPVEEAPVEEAPVEEAPAETAGQENARRSAESYLDYERVFPQGPDRAVVSSPAGLLHGRRHLRRGCRQPRLERAGRQGCQGLPRHLELLPLRPIEQLASTQGFTARRPCTA